MADFMTPIWDPINLQQCNYPENIPERNRTFITEDQRKQMYEKINKLRKDQLKYLSSHPEIRAILKEFLDQVWNYMPASNLIPKFCREYFGQCKYELAVKISKHLPKIERQSSVSTCFRNAKCRDIDDYIVPEWSWSSSESDNESESCHKFNEFVSFERLDKTQRIIPWKKFQDESEPYPKFDEVRNSERLDKTHRILPWKKSYTNNLHRHSAPSGHSTRASSKLNHNQIQLYPEKKQQDHDLDVIAQNAFDEFLHFEP